MPACLMTTGSRRASWRSGSGWASGAWSAGGGWAKARELLLLPRTVKADEAVSLGLATEVVPADDVLSRAQELAAQLASGPTVAYAALRRALNRSAAQSFDEALEYEAEMMELTGETHDHRRAVEAFLNKQKPTFHGR
jgi:2-(1,2-epoxy-1,2-dihydrophenyl)acetyl-CoA isomerase